jgi:hypothetical protein
MMRRTSLGILALSAIAVLGLGACSGAPPAPLTPIPGSSPTGAPSASAAPSAVPPAATTGPGPAVSTAPVPTPHVKIQMTIDLAKNIAVQALGGGRVIGVDNDTVNNVAVWKVTVETPDGRRHKVSIDKQSGAILANVEDNS